MADKWSIFVFILLSLLIAARDKSMFLFGTLSWIYVVITGFILCCCKDMAASSSLLFEEMFHCSLCLYVFTQPVSMPCGHNFCSGCIHRFRDSKSTCFCPLSNRPFSTRPELQVNEMASDLAAEFKMSVQVRASMGSEVDVCSEVKDKAVNSCLMCLVSFCRTHFDPHERVAGLWCHTLTDHVKNLNEKICKMHNKLTELYCRTDQCCICVFCFTSKHKLHSFVRLEE